MAKLGAWFLISVGFAIAAVAGASVFMAIVLPKILDIGAKTRNMFTVISGSALYIGFLLMLAGTTHVNLLPTPPSVTLGVIRTVTIVYCLAGLVYLIGFHIGKGLNKAFPALESGVDPEKPRRPRYVVFFEVVMEVGILSIIYLLFHGFMRLVTTPTNVYDPPSVFRTLANLLSFQKFKIEGWFGHLLTLPKTAVTGFFMISLFHGHTELMDKVRYLSGTSTNLNIPDTLENRLALEQVFQLNQPRMQNTLPEGGIGVGKRIP